MTSPTASPLKQARPSKAPPPPPAQVDIQVNFIPLTNPMLLADNPLVENHDQQVPSSIPPTMDNLQPLHSEHQQPKLFEDLQQTIKRKNKQWEIPPRPAFVRDSHPKETETNDGWIANGVQEN